MTTARTENTTRGIIVLVAIFLLLICGIIFFSRYLITNISMSNPASSALALVIAVALPLILCFIVVFQIARLMRQRRQKKPGAGLKMRITIFFILIALLCSIPQGVLAVIFVNSAMGTWFGKSIGESLRGASRISMEYYKDKVENLGTFASSSSISALIGEFAASPEKTWRKIQGLNAGIDALQLFTADGALTGFQGDERARVAAFPLISGTGSQQEDRADVTILRDTRRIAAGGRRYVAIFSSLVPRELTANARMLTGSLTVVNQIDRYRELFQIVLIGFFFVFSLPIFFISVLVSLLLTERIISPIVSLEEATQRVAEGDFSFRILTRSRDELSNLVDSFNVMIAELDHSRKKLLQAERITAWQEIAQRLAHEIRNPLTPIKLSAQRILRKHQEAGAEGFGRVLEGSVSAIIGEVESLEKLLRDFSDFAKLPVPQPKPVVLKGLVDDVASMYANLSGSVRISTEEIKESVVVNVDRDQMKQVFANLFKNAIQAMPYGGLLSLRVDTVRKGHSAYYRIAVSDTGMGIEEKDLQRIFDPYFTTKKDGTGLGLAIAQRIVFDHNGNIWVESEKNEGTTFFIDLPLGA